MKREIGHIVSIFRYPVKSMAGTELKSAKLGFHGIEGDRRFAFHRVTEKGGFPWLSASLLPELILFKPIHQNENEDLAAPTHVRTPEGIVMEILSKELDDEISNRLGSEVKLMNLRQGVFDDAPVSVISRQTISGIEKRSERLLDIRRFRPNFFIETISGYPFEEDDWLGRTVYFGEEPAGAAVSLTLRDKRCVMVNFDPDNASPDSNIMRSIIKLNENFAGAYGTVIRTGVVKTGQKIFLSDKY